MIVIFVSECEKASVRRTRQILDCFAERIGSRSWKTRITMEGLKAVKLLLSKSATRQTSVACHRIAGRLSTELMWVVGNKDKFDRRGICPTNYTEADHINDSENDWFLLPHIKTATALAALFHDLGKSSERFQKKLRAKSVQKDPFRHEWVSCVLLKHFIGDAITDEEWLKKLINDGFSIKLDKKDQVAAVSRPLRDLPPLASVVMWLVLSHHRLPLQEKDKVKLFRSTKLADHNELFDILGSEFDYQNKFEPGDELACLKFPKGLPVLNPIWNRQVKRWAAKALDKTSELEEIVKNGMVRLVMYFSRLCLMLGDHYYSSKKADENWKKDSELYANTGKVDDKRSLKQLLDEHLVGVMESSLRIAHQLPEFEAEMPETEDIRGLRKRSPQDFSWQDKAVEEIGLWRGQVKDIARTGFFAVNMASTGCGKTIANAKIMWALSKDRSSLRYIMALGLRTLTLQTGEVYRREIGLDSTELAVLIGSKAIRELFEKDRGTKPANQVELDLSSESSAEILDETLDYDCDVSEEKLATVLQSEKHRQLLYAPVLVCTIDHLMSATESTRSGHHILPGLRLMSSDLVIDEIDDFVGDDLIAISRLVHLAGMLGRKVMLSSATIPPDLALGFFNAYQSGYRLFAASKNIPPVVGCAWIDEFKTNIDSLKLTEAPECLSEYADRHAKFSGNRCGKIMATPVRRKGFIADVSYLAESALSAEEQYFAAIRGNIVRLHEKNFEKDQKTGISISWGVVRVANIKPCVALGRYLINSEWQEDTEVRVMVYHSQQILILRHVQEKILDGLLKRKNPDEIFKSPIIRNHLDKCKKANLIYILVATPVEEIGRDHDFSWSVIEPSSYRSIIQMAGRVRRHRRGAWIENNIAVMQFNLKGFKNMAAGKCGEKVFNRPGYEESMTLKSHDLKELVDERMLETGINSIPRVTRKPELKPENSLIDLEHHVTHQTLADFSANGPEKPAGWLNEYWWLTGIPQVLTRFRAGMRTENLYLVPENHEDEDTKFVFMQKDDNGDFVKVEDLLNITHSSDEINLDRLWLKPDYYGILVEYGQNGYVFGAAARYGSVELTIYEEHTKYEYSPVFGLVKK